MKKARPERKPEDFEKIKLLHELEVHQAELEAQNQELRASREEAQEALDKYSELYEFSPVGMLSLSWQGKIIECNMAAAELLGYPRAQLLHKDLRVFIMPAFLATFTELLKKILDSSTKQYGELELCGKEGESIYCQLVGLSGADSRTNHKQFRLALMDISLQKQKQDEMHELYLELRRVNEGLAKEITERKRIETEREQLIKELGAKNAEMGQFTYTVSHDLRSPLFTIKGFTTLARDDLERNEIAKVEESLKRIENAATKMDHFLNDTLELSRIGRMINPSEDVPFGEIVEEALELTAGHINRVALKSRRLTISLRFTSTG